MDIHVYEQANFYLLRHDVELREWGGGYACDFPWGVGIQTLTFSPLDPLMQCMYIFVELYEPVHEISDNVVCATSKASEQPAHTHSLIRAFASRLGIL